MTHSGTILSLKKKSLRNTLNCILIKIQMWKPHYNKTLYDDNVQLQCLKNKIKIISSKKPYAYIYYKTAVLHADRNFKE